MKLGALFSGGKDSVFALHKAMQAGNKIACLISVISRNPESYMFHTPNIHLTKLQAEAMSLPIITGETKGEKEKELKDLEKVVSEAKDGFDIQGVVTGAVESVYQSRRMQKICSKLGLACINPLWKREQKSLLEEMVSSGFRIIVTGVFAGPLGREWLGREIDSNVIEELVSLKEKWKISPAGEGGEIETTVLDGPVFGKRIRILEAEKRWEGDSGVLMIKRAVLEEKQASGIH